MMTRHPRAPLLVAGPALALVAAATGIALAVRPPGAGVPLDPTIPHEAVLIARGLSGAPRPGQPDVPVAVDRVVIDGATTYVQFHTTSTYTPRSPVEPSFFPRLSDDTGTPVNANAELRFSPPPALPVPFPVPSWFPWRPSVVTRGVLTLGPLPPTARAAVLHFFPTVGPLGAPGEMVRVPLNLAALRRVPAYSGPLVQHAGLTLRVAAARDTGLVVGYGLSDDLTSLVILGGVTLRDARGHAVPLTAQSNACAGGGLPDVQLTCRQVWAYPLQPRGARLTLTIQSFSSATRSASPIGPGPWQLPVTIP